jgi:hypothetical protein
MHSRSTLLLLSLGHVDSRDPMTYPFALLITCPAGAVIAVTTQIEHLGKAQ